VFIRNRMGVRRRSGRGVGCSFVMQVVALVVVLAVVVTATRRLFAWSELELSLALPHRELLTARRRTIGPRSSAVLAATSENIPKSNSD
jgi:hypothetical protein